MNRPLIGDRIVGRQIGGGGQVIWIRKIVWKIRVTWELVFEIVSVRKIGQEWSIADRSTVVVYILAICSCDLRKVEIL